MKPEKYDLKDWSCEETSTNHNQMEDKWKNKQKRHILTK